MATRIAARHVSRRFSSSGKIFSEEEKAAENIFIKKTEQEKLAKMARKGPKPEEKPAADAAATSGTGADSKLSSPASSASGASTEKVSSDKFRNYAIVAGTVTAFGALGWYLKSSGKKVEEVQD